MSFNELEKKVWYRLVRVAYGVLLVAAFFAPLFLDGSYFEEGYWVIDGIINIIVWGLLVVVFDKLILYVVYGKSK